MKKHPVLRTIAGCALAVFLLAIVAVALLATYVPFMRIDQGFSQFHALEATTPPASAAMFRQYTTGWRALFPDRH